ncbi:Gfo/Idh/MocA family oxidoreductase [Fodinicurvata sp. EGI_FJ10296]|uniref:Gfo/Idh/MocA family protein n=1 Tax=Fodinicurvata sp. EGI_FJ10296 TaxID=3231908 RepID=UPI003456ADC2
MTMNIGWIGCGRHASQMLLPQLTRFDARLAAVCDTDAGRRGDVARQFGVTAAFDDYREMLAHPGLDAIGMAVGPGLHVEAGIAALKRGLPVFMEKPPGATGDDARRLADAADSAGKPIAVGFMKRYSVGNRIARNVIADKDFGPVLGFYGSYMTAPTYFEGNADYTGFFLHHCVHYMDLPAHLVSPIADMTVRAREHQPGKLLMHVDLHFTCGAVGTLVMGTVQSRGTPMESIQVMGDHRRVEVDNVINVAYHRDPPFKTDDPAAILSPGCDTLTWEPNFTAAANEDFKGYHGLLGDALALLRDGTPGAPTIHDGITAMDLLDKLRAGVTRALG